MHIYIYQIYTYICIYIYVYQIYTYICIHIYKIYTYICIYIYICIIIYIYIFTWENAIYFLKRGRCITRSSPYYSAGTRREVGHLPRQSVPDTTPPRRQREVTERGEVNDSGAWKWWEYPPWNMELWEKTPKYGVFECFWWENPPKYVVCFWDLPSGER